MTDVLVLRWIVETARARNRKRRMIWQAYKCLCTTLVTALLTLIACLHAGLDADSGAVIGLIAGVMVVAGVEMRVKW